MEPQILGWDGDETVAALETVVLLADMWVSYVFVCGYVYMCIVRLHMYCVHVCKSMYIYIYSVFHNTYTYTCRRTHVLDNKAKNNYINCRATVPHAQQPFVNGQEQRMRGVDLYV